MGYIVTDNYHKFRCIADRCSFSCCIGWEITVDDTSSNKWHCDEQHSQYLCANIKNTGSDNKAYINMGVHNVCPFLNKAGLCNIVISCGEDYLSETCKTFPRLDNQIGDISEDSLSCACPEVVDMLQLKDGRIQFHNDIDEKSLAAVPSEFWIRERMIQIFQNTEYSLKDRILIVFHMLLRIREEDVNSTEILADYKDEQTLASLVECWTDNEIPQADALLETNELFLDIVLNYRKENLYKPYLQEIYDIAAELDSDNDQILLRLREFHKPLKTYDNLFENCMVSKIFSSCTGNGIDEIIASFQMIITELIMIRHSSFLKYLLHDKISGEKHCDVSKYTTSQDSELSEVKDKITYNDIRDYIVIFSRIIGYNSEGMKEFWVESFDNAVWELGYLLLFLSC